MTEGEIDPEHKVSKSDSEINVSSGIPTGEFR